MPDISMCQNKTCPLNQKCYRFKATPSSHWQAYANFTPVVDPTGKTVCNHYMEIHTKPDKK